jgi:acetyl esterase/lipase
VTGIILKYRVPSRSAPLQDGQRAISMVRSKAAELKIDPNRIGMLGFSAGAHLTAFTANNFSKRMYPEADAIDKISSRPDFAVLVYPGFLANDNRDALARDIHVHADCPPTFLIQAGDDAVGPENSALTPGTEARRRPSRASHLRLGEATASASAAATSRAQPGRSVWSTGWGAWVC